MDPIDPFKTAWTLARIGFWAMVAAFIFLSCTGQLPSDPGSGA